MTAKLSNNRASILLYTTLLLTSVLAGPITKRDNVKLNVLPFDMPLYQVDGIWKADFQAYVYSHDAEQRHLPWSRTAKLARAMEAMGLAVGNRRKTLAERTRMFFTTSAASVAMTVSISGCDMKIKAGQSNQQGMIEDQLAIGKCDSNTSPRNVTIIEPVGEIVATAHPTTEGDFGIISDVDDTIKESFVLDARRSIRAAFLDPMRYVNGMPKLFNMLKENMKTPQIFFVSGSPNQMYPVLKKFIGEHFPPAPIITRNFVFGDILDILRMHERSNLFDYKISEIEKIYKFYPKKKFLLIGDSTQADPEVYGEIYRRHKDSVQCIWIRSVDNANNNNDRFERAFKDVPKEKWTAFKDPKEIMNTNVVNGKCK